MEGGELREALDGLGRRVGGERVKENSALRSDVLCEQDGVARQLVDLSTDARQGPDARVRSQITIEERLGDAGKTRLGSVF